MLQERLRKVKRTPQTVINEISCSTRHAPVTVVKQSTFKIPTFDKTGPWKLYHKQIEIVSVHNRQTCSKKECDLNGTSKGASSIHVGSITSEWHHQISHTGKQFGTEMWTKTHCPPQEEMETQEPHTKVLGRITRLCSKHPSRRLVQKAYPSMYPKFVDSAAVNSFVDGNCDWEVHLLVGMHSCKEHHRRTVLHTVSWNN